MEGISYLESLAQWKGRGGFGLEKLRRVMAALHNPQNAVKSIHIAGTNGKGSVSATVASILGATGQRVLLTTSPHLVRVNERIMVDGAQIADCELNAIMLRIKAVSEAIGEDLSHFEGITAAAFLAAVQLEVDVMVAEVGLGGRLDATNIIEKPEVCAITSIGFDHEAILGDTLEKIAVEKAGIIKPNCPVVIGKMPEAAQWEIISKARSVGASCLIYGQDFLVERVAPGVARFTSGLLGSFEISPALSGLHQDSNMGVAVAIGRLLNIGEDQVRSGVQSVKWPGRLEFCSYKGSELILDAAHNPQGVESFISFLDANGWSKIELIFGVIGTKRWKEIIGLLLPYVERWHLMTPDFSEAIPASEVAEYLSGFGVKVTIYGDNYLKLLSFIEYRAATTPLAALGSIYMIGKLRGLIEASMPQVWVRAE